MNWWEWVFNGIGTVIISALTSYIGYKAAIKKMSVQTQIAKDNAEQRQEITENAKENNKDVSDRHVQIQKARNNVVQSQNINR